MLVSRPSLLATATLALSAAFAPVAHAAESAGSAQADGCSAADSRLGEASAAKLRAATLCLLNNERRKRGRSSLRLNRKLGLAATRHSRQMVAERFFGHVSPDGSTLTTRVKKTSYLKRARSWSLGENVAWGTGPRSTPSNIVEGWMNSPGHRANILSRRFKDIGIGIVSGTPSGAGDGATYTTDFGRRG